LTIRKILFGSIVSFCVLFVVVTSAQVIQEKSEPINRMHETPDDSEVNQKTDAVSIIHDQTEVDVAGGSIFENTGADRCADVTVVPVPVGPEGSPLSVTILGDNTSATAPDCRALGPVPVWWEAFEIDQSAIITIDLCNTSPVQEPSYFKLVLQCTTPLYCQNVRGSLLDPIDSGRGFPVCSDGNAWMTFKLSSSGIYYYPVFSNESELLNGRGPYEIHISAEEHLIIGSDIITGNIAGVSGNGFDQLDREGEIGSGIVGLGIATTACNQGGKIARWIALPNINHPVMTGNLYKLHELNGSDRLEQIGYAWIKHGEGSSNDDECGFGCVCTTENDCGGSSIGPGCSDPYAAGQFAPCGIGFGPAMMGPRSAIHPYTGVIPMGNDLGAGGGCEHNYPSTNHIGHNHPPADNGITTTGISHRLQVKDTDLIHELNMGVRYFGEGQYIVPDEYLVNNGTQNNNVSHREVDVTGPDIDGVFVFSSLADTVVESPAVDAWPGAEQSLIEPFPMSDGQSRLAYKVTNLGGGMWHYEYAVYNMNMDVSVGSLSLPIPTSTTISNIEFFAPVHHAPELNADNYSNDPWVVTQGDGQLTWSTDTFVTDPLANAVRWGTLYNFRFDADSPPQSQLATIGLYKTGGLISVPTLVPQAVGATDCNNNGINDACDLNCALAGCNVTGCGESVDCDGTGVPDECEIDCNGNGVADSCDIASETSADCTGNLIPDECEPDCNNNGVADFCDIVAQVSSDTNSNGIPDECEIFAPDPVLPDPDSPGGLACGGGPNYGLPCSTCSAGMRAGKLCTDSDDCAGDACEPNDSLCPDAICGNNIAGGDVINIPWPKNRYIGFKPPSSWTGKEIAIRVTAVDVPSNPSCTGEVRWLGAPSEYCESFGGCPVKFNASKLEITASPLFMDWTTLNDAVQIYGEEITPGARYSIQAVDITFQSNLDKETIYSNGLLVETAVWGDVIKPLGSFSGGTQPDVADVLALVGKWLSQLRPVFAISQLQPADIIPTHLTVDDVLIGVNAWLGSPYPFSVTTCP